ncbi:restriction endonuclease subunit S [Listeria monocytogenes]|nr:restriction endonuclease subunit S [Listeria monocytogenes]EFR5763956.1 restriction endonuclease subunit S [Listeria monocytogenes]EIP9814333.1 restriction endonuclease subunit S [Listeria monocytogenes]EIQ6258179.1 restriction endonuclease subunit S [Listeria monocytogenes]EIQ6286414.1 restriction endonuclease subunit S [Listeria monocytogenes]
MKKLEKSVPVIRFKGFSEAWEQRKLGEVTESFDGKRVPIDSDLRISGEYPYYGATGIIDYVDDYIFDGEYVLLAEDGANITMRNYPVAYLTQGKFWLNNHAHIMRMIDGSNYFLVQVLEKIDYMKYNTGTAQPKLNSKVVKNIEFKLPHVEEQRKIGTFFKQLDDTIALHQRKLEVLKLMKKGFLQQMVTKSGENIPKIRFDDFDDIWEQRILGEFLKESKIKGSNGSLAKKLTVKLWRKGVVPKEEIYTGSSATQYYIRKTGQFMYGKLDFLNQAFGIVPLELDGYESTLDSPAFDIEESLNETFLLEYVSLARFYKYQGNIANGSRRAKRIHTDTFFEMPIPLPNSNEQQKIGTFSRQIDDLIALQQNKLEKLSSLKRFYLKNMFI